MSNEEKLKKIEELCERLVRKSWIENPELIYTSERSYGNYDDCYEDGVIVGGHYAGESILGIIKS